MCRYKAIEGEMEHKTPNKFLYVCANLYLPYAIWAYRSKTYCGNR
jgi:hypothetical protein